MQPNEWYNRTLASIIQHLVLIAVFVLLCVGPADAQQQFIIGPPVLDQYPLVKIPFQVRTGGTLWENLALDQFTVFENGVQVVPLYVDCETDTIWEPITFLFVLDASNSMKWVYGTDVDDPNFEKWFAAKTAFSNAINALRPGDAGALYSLYRATDKEVGYTKDKDALLLALDRMWFLPGTHIYDTIIDVVTDSYAYPGRKVMILLTDGADIGSTNSLDGAINLAIGANVSIFCIGLDVRPEDEADLQRIALETGGEYHYAPSSETLQRVMQSISQSIFSKRCVLVYQSLDTCRDGRTRNVQIRLDLPGYSATREASYTLADDRERIEARCGIPGTALNDGTSHEIPFQLSGFLDASKPLALEVTVHYDPAVLAFNGLVPSSGVANTTAVSVNNSVPGVITLSGGSIPLSQSIPRGEYGTLFALQFDALIQDQIVHSALTISGLIVSQDCPALSQAYGTEFTVSGCPREVLVGIDSSVIAFGGREVTVPVLVHSPIDSQQELEYAFTVFYDASVLTYVRVETDETISSDLPFSAVEVSPGELRITALSGLPLGRTGELFRLVFHAKSVRDPRRVDVHLERGYVAQSCVPLVKTSGNGIMLDGDCNKIVRRRDFFLGQSSPNPAAFQSTSEVVIEYRVTGTAPVSLIVYDVEGQPVATLVDGMQPRGSHAARFRTAGLSAGTYIYVLREGDNVWTRKMSVGK